MDSSTVIWQGEFDWELQYTKNHSREPESWHKDGERKGT